jgi:hypothetical protein
MNTFARLLVIGGALGLSACGGGEGNGGLGGPAPPDPATITEANAPVITSAVLTSAFEGAKTSGFTGIASAGSAGSLCARVHAEMARIQRAEIKSVTARVEAGLVQVEFGPETTPCGVSGSVTVSGKLATPGTFTADDTLTLDYDACVDLDAEVDGRLDITITRFSGDLLSGTFTFGMSVVATSFAVTANGETGAVDGTLTLDVDATPGTQTTTVGASSLGITSAGETHTLSDYAFLETLDSVTAQFSLDLGGTLSSTAFEGAVTFETSALLVGTGSAFAASGELLITGANGATIHLAVLDSTFVRLTIDTDGDGTVDVTLDLTWDELA